MTIINPYLTEYAALPDEAPMWAGQVVGKIRFDRITYRDHRHELVTKYAWAVPSVNVIHALSVNHKRIVEIGAGTGYWAWMLKQAGVDVVAYDKHPPSRRKLNNWGHHVKTYHPIRKGNHKAALIHSDRTLMLCWPPYDNDMAFNCLINYSGNKLIFIGENDGGCTANEKFFDLLRQYWNLVNEYDIPQWDGIHDSVYEYVRL